MLFVLCHMGEMIVSCYEIRQRLAQTEADQERNSIDIRNVRLELGRKLRQGLWLRLGVCFLFVG